MTEAERKELKAKLVEFSERLDACVRDLRERGEFTDAHRALIEELERRHNQVQKRLALAEANGTAWELVKSQTERDFSSLWDALLQLNEQLDADEMKSGQ